MKKKKIVFICVENARRSQMAEAFAKALGREEAEVYSAGSRSSSQVDPIVVEVMKEKGIDISGKRPKVISAGPTPLHLLSSLDHIPPILPDSVLRRDPELSLRSYLH